MEESEAERLNNLSKEEQILKPREPDSSSILAVFSIIYIHIFKFRYTLLSCQTCRCVALNEPDGWFYVCGKCSYS